MKDRVIRYLESLGFETVSHSSSTKKIFFKDNVAVIVEDRVNKK